MLSLLRVRSSSRYVDLGVRAERIPLRLPSAVAAVPPAVISRIPNMCVALGSFSHCPVGMSASFTRPLVSERQHQLYLPNLHV